MTSESQRIAIAEVCGWLIIETLGDATYGIPPTGKRDSPLPIPNYLSDLNAMYEAEKVLKWEQRKQYHTTLADVAGFSYCEADTQEETKSDWNCRICHATAPQRAEAFLRTLNLWDDTK